MEPPQTGVHDDSSSESDDEAAKKKRSETRGQKKMRKESEMMAAMVRGSEVLNCHLYSFPMNLISSQSCFRARPRGRSR